MDCKCGIDVREIGGNCPPVPVIVWCPLHKAAPALLAACEAAQRMMSLPVADYAERAIHRGTTLAMLADALAAARG